MRESLRQQFIDNYYAVVDKELQAALSKLGYTKRNVYLLEGRLHVTIRDDKTTYYLDDQPLLTVLPLENYLEERE